MLLLYFMSPSTIQACNIPNIASRWRVQTVSIKQFGELFVIQTRNRGSMASGSIVVVWINSRHCLRSCLNPYAAACQYVGLSLALCLATYMPREIRRKRYGRSARQSPTTNVHRAIGSLLHGHMSSVLEQSSDMSPERIRFSTNLLFSATRRLCLFLFISGPKG